VVHTVTTRLYKLRLQQGKITVNPNGKQTVETKIIDYSLSFVFTEIQRESKRRQGNRLKQSLDNLKGKNKVLEFEGGNTGSRSVEKSLWKRLWTCRRTENVVMK